MRSTGPLRDNSAIICRQVRSKRVPGGGFVELESTLSAGAPEQGVGDTVGLFESGEVARIGK
jgi:hypothetical protein